MKPVLQRIVRHAGRRIYPTPSTPITPIRNQTTSASSPLPPPESASSSPLPPPASASSQPLPPPESASQQPLPPPSGPSSPSVNPSEISHFNALASTWWDPHGSSRALHLMNPHRHTFIRSCLSSSPIPPPATIRYLDVGCGGGIFAESAARLPTISSVTAIDPSTTILSVAKAHAARDPALVGTNKLDYRNTTIEGLDKGEEGAFDVVTLFEVIEHVDDPASFLDHCGRFVKPGGWLVLSTIARTWTSWFTTNLVAEDILGIVPKGTHDWRKYINEDEMTAHFAKRKEWGSPRVMGVVYVPGLGWKEVPGSEKVGNYFFAVRRLE